MSTRQADPPAIEEMVRLGQRVLDQSPEAPQEGMLLVRPLPGLRLVRHFRSTAFEATIYEPVVCLILQGRKETTFGERSFKMGAGESLLVSHELPADGKYLMGALALCTNADVYAANKIQWYGTHSGMRNGAFNFDVWEGILYKFSAATGIGEMTDSVPVEFTEVLNGTV
jgi:hypothetical protein